MGNEKSPEGIVLLGGEQVEDGLELGPRALRPGGFEEGQLNRLGAGVESIKLQEQFA